MFLFLFSCFPSICMFISLILFSLLPSLSTISISAIVFLLYLLVCCLTFSFPNFLIFCYHPPSVFVCSVFFCFFYRLSTVFVSRNVHCLIISFPFSFSFCTYLAHSHMVYGCVAMTLDFISSVKISTIHSKPTHKTFELNLPAVLQPSDNLKPEVEENVFAKYFFY